MDTLVVLWGLERKRDRAFIFDDLTGPRSLSCVSQGKHLISITRSFSLSLSLFGLYAVRFSSIPTSSRRLSFTQSPGCWGLVDEHWRLPFSLSLSV